MSKAPTIIPDPYFDAEQHAKDLKEACQGFGTDEAKIIEILTKCSNEQRQEIILTYKTMFGEDLIDALKSELGGNFEKVILALMTPRIKYQAEQLHEAISGAGTDEAAIAEILSIHDNEDIKRIAQEYENLYETTLESDLIGDSSGTLRHVFVALSTGGRNESQHTDLSKAIEDAQALYEAGPESWGTEESAFNAVLCQRSRPQLKLMFDEYEKLKGEPFEACLENEFSGSTLDALLSIVASTRNTPEYLATRLHDAMAGAGTDETTLIRIIVGRSEIDLQAIKEAFYRKYEQNLSEWIDSDVSGDFKRCLLAIVH